MPTDPREAIGVCGNTSPWQPPLQSWQTGGAGAGDIPAAVKSNLAWPPTEINGAGALDSLPSYTPTGPLVTLPVPTYTAAGSSASAGSGWNNPSDNAGMNVPISGCTYPDPWVNPTTAPPPVCAAGGGAAARRAEALEPRITSPPQS